MKRIVNVVAVAVLLAGCGGGTTAERAATVPASQSPTAATSRAPASSSDPASQEIDPTCEVVARVRAELPDLAYGPLDDEMAGQYRDGVTALQAALPDLAEEAGALPDSPLSEGYRMALAFMGPKAALYLSQLGDWSITDGDGSRQLKEMGEAITAEFDDVLAACPTR